VAFRILGWFPDAIIQTIAVFPEATPHINSGSNSAAGRSQRLATPIREPHAPRGRALPSVREGADAAAFPFADGRAAHVAVAHTQDAVVTYLAVEAPGSTTLPQIGHFAHKANGHAKPLYSDGGGGDGFGPPPADP
jgi:hypothetical protein